MPLASSSPAASLQRRIGLRSAVAFNMLEMIGVGPFITLPLVIAAAGFRLSVWAWVLGAVIAVADAEGCAACCAVMRRVPAPARINAARAARASAR